MITISVNTKQLKTSEREVERFTGKTEKEFKKTERATKSLGGSMGVLKGAIAGYISFETLRRTVMFTDHMRGLELQIKDMTRATGDFEQVRKGLIGITMETGAALDANVALAQNVGRAARDMGKSNDQVLQFIENTNKAAIIGGASATEMKFAMRQLSQAMASTNVRAEEFNSILENTPGLAAEIAEGMSMTVTEMRAVMLQGKLSSEEVFDAILKRTEELDQKFSEMPLRLGQSIEKLKASWGDFLLEMEEVVPVTGFLAWGFENMAFALGEMNDGLYKSTQFFSNQGDSMKYNGILASQLLDKQTELANKWNSLSSEQQKNASELERNLEALAKSWSSLSGEARLYAHAMSELTALNEEFNQGAISEDHFRKEQERLRGVLEYRQGLIDAAIASRELAKANQEEYATYNKNFAIVSELYSSKLQTLESQRDITQAVLDSAHAGKEERKVALEVLGVINRQIGKIHEKNAAMSEIGMADKELIGIMRSLETGEERINRVYDERASKIRENKLLQEGLAAGVSTEGLLTKNEIKRQEELKRIAVKGTKDRLQAISDVESEFESVRSELQSPLEREMERYSKSHEALISAKEQRLLTETEYNSLLEKVEEDHMARLTNIKNEGGANMLSSVKKMKEEEMRVYATQVSLAGQIFGEFNDVLKKAGKEGTAIQKATFLANKALAVAEILVNTHLAASKAATINPLLYTLTMAQGYASAGMVAGMAVADVAGKATGGDVSQFNAYRVNEQGTEMLTQGGQDYLLMGSQKGHITPAHEVGKGGGAPVIKIINMTSGQVQQSGVRQNSQGEYEVVIKEAVNRSMDEWERRMDVKGNTTSDAMRRNFDVREAV